MPVVGVCTYPALQLKCTASSSSGGGSGCCRPVRRVLGIWRWWKGIHVNDASGRSVHIPGFAAKVYGKQQQWWRERLLQTRSKGARYLEMVEGHSCERCQW